MKKFISLIGHFKTSIKISIKASPSLFIGRIAFELLNVFLPILISYITKLIINVFEHPTNDISADTKTFTVLIGTMVLVQVISMVTGKFDTYISNNHNDRVSHEIQLMISKKINSLDISYFDNPKFYDQIQNANLDSQSLISLSWLITAIFRGISQIISCGVILGKLNPFIPFIILALNIPSAFIDNHVAKKKYDWQLSRMTNERRIGYIQAILNGKGYSKDIRVFNIKGYMLNKFESLWRSWFKEKMKIARSRMNSSYLASMLPYAATVFVFVFIGIKIVHRTATISDYTFYTSMTAQFISGIATFLSSINQGYESEMRLTNFSKFLNWETILDESGTETLDGINEIEFCNVSFTYPNTDVEILKNVSFKIEKNIKIAFVGLNGAGKSTLVKLLLRLYEPTSGVILINGKDIKQYSIESIRQNMSVVFQDFNRYDLSIRENVAIADLSRLNDDADIQSALQNADLQIRQELKNGLDTQLGKTFDPDGIELSGGQWQKIAISQAYFKPASFVIMDEPNSSLDPDAEHRLFLNMKDICKDKGAIFITHRLSSVSIADKIIVLDAGVCKEIGTHKELMRKKGVYYNLFNEQAQKYTSLQNA